MTYIENIFVCMAAPLAVAALCMGRRHKRTLCFCVVGMLSCLLAAYLNTFFARLAGADLVSATAEIAPAVEEI